MTTASFAKLLTTTMTHKRPNGSGGFSTIASGLACSPADPLSQSTMQQYPIEKPFVTRQVFTTATGIQPGDYITIGSKTYSIQVILPYAALGAMDAYTMLIVEELLP